MSYSVAENSSTGSNFACCVSVAFGSLYSIKMSEFWKSEGLLMEADMFLTHTHTSQMNKSINILYTVYKR